MQQTEKYKFNLIEKDDTFSPDPLNQNMETVEAQLNAVRAEAKAGDAALDQRLATLEARKLVLGMYTGYGPSHPINAYVGFRPTLLTIHYNTGCLLLTQFKTVSGITLTDTGFTVNTETWSAANTNYYYVAVL